MGGAPGSRDVITAISDWPISPLLIASLSAEKCGSKRRLKPTMRTALVSLTTSKQARTRSTLRSIGFSQKIAFPLRANCSIKSACVSVGVQIMTPSTSSLPAISSIVRTSHPYCSAMASAAAAIGSAIAVKTAASCPAIARACTCPMRPAPKTAIRTDISNLTIGNRKR